jgi:hypothetical protein
MRARGYALDLSLVGLLGAVVLALVLTRSGDATSVAAVSCPAGTMLLAEREALEQRAGLRPAAKGSVVRGRGSCVARKQPEPLIELILRQEGLESARSAPYHRAHPGAYANALAEKNEHVKKHPKTKDTAGTWTALGKGPLVVNDPDYPEVNGLGLVYNMGRLDSLEYDAVNKRLFAAKGTGGLWMSTDGGASWRSIGDTLPSQIVGAVGWTPANGGTVVAVSGDATFGSGGYTGYGAFYSTNLGGSWQKATGIPDGALGFAIEADPTNALEVYAATSFGLFRSTDGGRSYVNTRLPTGECAGVAGGGSCHLANVVTDVEVKAAGGVNSTVASGTVVAVVGWRGGNWKNADGTTQSPANGVYRSATGGPGSFAKLAAAGFPGPDRMGRTELGATIGAQQDKDYLYAIVQDAAALNSQQSIVDLPVTDPNPFSATVLQGVYASADFGATWTLMGDDNTIARNPATGTAMIGAPGVEPGVQAWYNLWIAPDPTRQTAAGIPTRLAFGLEEVWQNELTSVALDGPTAFKVIARYFGDTACFLRPIDPPECPHNRPPTTSNTTHPDQQDGIWLPDGTGGVTLAVGNDGGFYRNHVAAGVELDNGGWGDGDQTGFNTLLPYDVAMAKDGTVFAGLQDNGHLKITPEGKQIEVFGGDGTFAEVDPDRSDVAYEAYVFNAMSVTTDGGRTWRSIDPGLTSTRFINPFEMDPLNANHLVTAGNEVAETIYGPETNGPDANTGACSLNCWAQVFDLGTRSRPGDATAEPPTLDPTADPKNSMSAIDVVGEGVYVGFCGVCDILNQKVGFKNGIATNVGGSKPARRMTSDGWHVAAAQGLPNRFITSIAIDPRNVRTIYVTLGGYSRRWVPPGTLGDPSGDPGVGHLFRSTDAGQSFTDVSGNLPDVPATWVTLRGSQLIVGTDVGVFAGDLKGGTSFAALTGLPNVPISTMNLKPGDPNLLVVATYGRGVWTYRFEKPLPNPPVVTSPTCVNTTEAPPAAGGTTLAGPFGFESGEEGWTVASSNPLLATWRRLPPGADSTFAFGVAPYNGDGFGDTTTTVSSPRLDQAGGWVFVEFRNQLNTEPGFDYLFVDWSCDGGAWNTVPWIWDPGAGAWSRTRTLSGMNASFPLFDAEKVAFKAPAGPVHVRFRFVADPLLGSPAYTGLAIDDVALKR